MIHAFPKIFAIGSTFIQDLLKGKIECTEKLDGSMCVFGKINGELYIRSKGAQLFIDNPEKMFQKAIDYAVSIKDKMANNTVYYCEFLNSPNHNVLKYNRVPQNNLILFGVSDEKGNFEKTHAVIRAYADKIDIETVPLLYEGKIENPDELLKILETESVLGGTKIEGIVIKNYEQPFLLGGQPIPIMMGKYVSEKFKEVHRKSWGRKFSTKGRMQVFLESFKTEARWLKGIQHLKERGELENSPRDIGKLLKEIQQDIEAEEKENVKEFLWQEYRKEIFRSATRGFPEFYKKWLIKKSFNHFTNK